MNIVPVFFYDGSLITELKADVPILGEDIFVIIDEKANVYLGNSKYSGYIGNMDDKERSGITEVNITRMLMRLCVFIAPIEKSMSSNEE